MNSTYAAGLVWFRRDLRAHDNAALSHALQACGQVHCAFVFDKDILDSLPRRDRRVEFIRESVASLDEDLRALAGRAGAGLITCHAAAAKEIVRLAVQLGARAVFANHDDEPLALQRDSEVRTALASHGIAFHTFKDHTIFERREVLTQAQSPYTVFTPYKRAWLAKLGPAGIAPHPVDAGASRLAERPADLRGPVPSLAELGFEPSNFKDLQIATGTSGGRTLLKTFAGRIDAYDETRNFPAINGPSYLGVHLRFGTISIREAVASALPRYEAGSVGAATWLSELVWRDFFFQVLANFPHVAGHNHGGASFRPAYDAIQWEEGPKADEHFAAWCEGRTGYPLVDAAMAQINSTGYMHNRLRMVVASFLTKDLGIDWRRGERYFAQQLNDYDLSANNGNWQWASSSGCDAQPYFRIFNPVSQSRRFDPDGKFIAIYLPQLAALGPRLIHEPWTAAPTKNYAAPIVMHDEAREKTLKRYAVVKGQ
ncbi:deoxyribodipyrimidine photo-lyase [Caenimonas sp. SL110]|uniref:cryptochrome/photolyase family protein n=1 Tax=Caenimonas sp. SL110 TaxID=1450524 RepID=UPI00065439BD